MALPLLGRLADPAPRHASLKAPEVTTDGLWLTRTGGSADTVGRCGL